MENASEQEVLEAMRFSLTERLKSELQDKKICAIIQTHPDIKYQLTDDEGKKVISFPLGHFKKPETVAKGLFAALRDLDNQGAQVILMEGISEDHEGLAVMNRIRKASSEIVKCVQNKL